MPNVQYSGQRPWNSSYPTGVRWGDELGFSPIAQLFDETVLKFASCDAILFRGHHYSFDWTAKEVRKLASALIANSFGGARVALLLPNAPFHPVSFFSILKAGGSVVQLSTFDAEVQMLHKLIDSQATVLFTTDNPVQLEKAYSAARNSNVLKIIVFEEARWGLDVLHPPIVEDDFLETYDRFVGAVENTPKFSTATSEQIALIQYTGGTTGLPKGAIITHGNIAAAVASYRRWFDSAEGVGREIVICALPLSHVYGLVTIFIKSFLAGSLISLHHRFKVADVLRDVAELKATTLPAVPTIWKEIVDFPGIEKLDLSSLKLCSAGGAPLSTSLKERVEALTGQFLRGGWGMTETVSAGTNRPATGLRKSGSIGVPLPGLDLEVVSLENGMSVAPGNVGEIRVRGANVISGYLHGRDHEAFADGWFRTGDLGYMDSDGYVFLVGRRKEMIIVNGLNVYPLVVEQAILSHPKIDEAIVIGVPDQRSGESISAYVTLREGSQYLELDELREHLGHLLGKHELPASLHIREALPKTSVGKLSRLDLMTELGISPAASTHV